jgi:hypothetical protein
LRNLVAAPARLRVSFALPPLFAISERSEKPERPRTDRADSVPVEAHGRPKPQQLPRRASSTTATPADDGTVNRWPWGARRVTPLSAEVVAAVRSRSNSP